MRIAIAAVVLGMLLTGPVAASSRQGAAQPVPATPQNAAAFVGDWTVDAGDASLTLSVKVVEGKLVGEVTAQTGTHAVETMSIAGPSLVLGYNFDYQGMAIDSVVTLTPNDKTKTIDVLLDFANGAAQFPGTATKKAAK
jgi:hypothetical protein